MARLFVGGVLTVGAAATAGLATWQSLGTKPPDRIVSTNSGECPNEFEDIEGLPPGTSLINKTVYVTIPTEQGRAEKIEVRVSSPNRGPTIPLQVGKVQFAINHQGRFDDLDDIRKAKCGGIIFISTEKEMGFHNGRNSAVVRQADFANAVATLHRHPRDNPSDPRVHIPTSLHLLNGPPIKIDLNFSCQRMRPEVAALQQQ